MKLPIKSSTVLLAIGILLGLTGCTSPMALNEARDSGLSLNEESIAIFTVKTANAYKPDYHPDVHNVILDDDETFHVNTEVRKGPQTGEYLVSVDAKPGKHSINDLLGSSSHGIIFGSFLFPVDATFVLQPNTITYIGHVEIVNRERKDGEPRSGSLFPLIDQAMSGYSGGTYDIAITDRYQTDIQLFANEYSIIQGQPIHKSIMVQ